MGPRIMRGRSQRGRLHAGRDRPEDRHRHGPAAVRAGAQRLRGGGPETVTARSSVTARRRRYENRRCSTITASSPIRTRPLLETADGTSPPQGFRPFPTASPSSRTTTDQWRASTSRAVDIEAARLSSWVFQRRLTPISPRAPPRNEPRGRAWRRAGVDGGGGDGHPPAAT